jgi:hypothetical protein
MKVQYGKSCFFKISLSLVIANKQSVIFNAATLERIMCRHLISVGWDGRLYECDFNQIPGMAILVISEISTMLCLPKERLSWTITALPVQQGKIQPEYAP